MDKGIIPQGPSCHAADARILLDAVEALGVEGYQERSLKLCDGQVLSERFLLSLHKSALGERPQDRIETLLADLGPPAAYIQDLSRHLDAADIVHFGYEGGTATSTIKLYLEFSGQFWSSVDATQGHCDPLTVHRAYKWDPHNAASHTLAHYRCQPFMSLDAMTQVMADIYNDSASPEPLDIANTLLRQAAAKLPEQDIFFLQVSEEGNARQSFDVNLYDAELHLRDIAPLLQRMAAHCVLSMDQVQGLFENLSDEALGHLSGGIGRDGKEFFTIYFGVRAWGPNKEQDGNAGI